MPLLGMSYLIARVVRRMTVRTWRATTGRPVLRIMAALAGALGLALLAWAWWPDGQYRPIQPNERGALTDVGFAAQPPGERLVLPGTQAVGFAETTPAVIADLGHTSAQPRLALVLSPRADGPGSESTVLLPPSETDSGASSESGWVFPFNPPPEMGEGDNRALAVNTEDGSSLYDVSFALVWVTDGSVDEINDAWALASCRDCRTVAVAFQAVFVLGEADVVVPQNIAVAANYDCTRCQTFALAKQFVATLSKAPSADAMRKLALIEQQLKELAANIEDIPLNQLQTELASIEAEILEILVKDNGAVPADIGLAQDSNAGAATVGTVSGEPGTTTTESETTTTAPSEEPTPESGDEPEPSPTPTPSPSPEPTPSQEPTPSPSGEPTPASTG